MDTNQSCAGRHSDDFNSDKHQTGVVSLFYFYLVMFSGDLTRNSYKTSGDT